MKLVVFGAGGQVGRELGRAPLPPAFKLLPFARTEVDIGDKGAVFAALFAEKPDCVVNLAAYTAVDRAESEAPRAWKVNCEGARNIAEACRGGGIPLIHLSTDYIFDGEKEGPYREDDAVHPQGVYGASKEAGERAVRALLSDHVILRTAWVFGAFGGNFVKTVLRLAAGAAPLRIVKDQIGSPTPASEIAVAVAAIASMIREKRAVWGTFHFAGAPPTSWYGFAEAVLESAAPFLSGRTRLEAITTAEYPTPARRPKNSVLDCGKIAAAYGLQQPSWREGVAALVKELLVPAPAAKGKEAR